MPINKRRNLHLVDRKSEPTRSIHGLKKRALCKQACAPKKVKLE